MIDDKLNEILTLCINEPKYFNNSFTDGYPENGNPSDDHYIKYSAYAYVVWNWIESVYDYYGESKIMESGVWGTVIHFKELHKQWFKNCDNQRQFNLHFREFIVDIDNYRTPINWYASINHRKTYWYLWLFVRISQLYRRMP